jgi:hypothetical protein
MNMPTKGPWTAERLAWLLWIPVLMIVFISVWTSAQGLHAYFSRSEHDEGSLAILFFAVAAAFHIVSVISFWDWRNRGKRSGLVAYAVLALLAIFLSYSWHWWHANADAVAAEEYGSLRSEIVRATIGTKEGFSYVVASLDTLKGYSQKTADDEQRTGGTCGGVPHATAGVRYRFRMADKQFFSDLADTARKREADLKTLSDAAQALPSVGVDTPKVVPQLIAIADQLSALTGDDRLVADIRKRLKERLELAKTGIGVENGKVVLCPDQHRESLVRAAIDATEGQKFTIRPILNPLSHKAAQKAAWRRIWKASMTVDDWSAFAAASIVEFTLFCLLMRLPHRRERVANAIGKLNEVVETEKWPGIEALRRLGKEYASEGIAFVRFIEKYVFVDRIISWYFRTPILAIPLYSDDEEHTRLRIIAAGLAESRDLAKYPLLPDWYYRLRLRCRWKDSPLRRIARLYELTFYKLNREAWNRILLAMALGDEPPPSSKQSPAGANENDPQSDDPTKRGSTDRSDSDDREAA